MMNRPGEGAWAVPGLDSYQKFLPLAETRQTGGFFGIMHPEFWKIYLGQD